MGSVVDIVPGTHINSIYRSLEEQFQVVVPLFAKGLSENDKCVYVTDSSLIDQVIPQFDKKYFDSGQLEILDNNTVYSTNGDLDVGKIMTAWKTLEEKSKKEGFRRLRICGQLPFFSNQAISSDKIIEYETAADEYLSKNDTIAICNYQEDKYDPSILLKLIKVHHFVAIYGSIHENKYFYTFPEYIKKDTTEFKPEDYKTVVDSITQD
jgi:hypothetical protein